MISESLTCLSTLRASSRERDCVTTHHLINNPAFVDGNKRVALFACEVFLRLNGWKLQVSPDTAHRFIVSRLESGTCTLENLLPWIDEHLTKPPGGSLGADSGPGRRSRH